jgi:hypothetical protein
MKKALPLGCRAEITPIGAGGRLTASRHFWRNDLEMLTFPVVRFFFLTNSVTTIGTPLNLEMACQNNSLN